MSRFRLFRKTLRDVRLPTILVTVVLTAMGIIDVLIYPQYKEALKGFESSAYQGFLGEATSFASPEGFMSAEFFSWIPLLLITVAIIGGTAALAGEEGAGTLDMLLAQPVSRRRLVLEKTAALAITLTVSALLSFPAFLVGGLFVDFPLGWTLILAAVVNMIPVTLLFLGLALAGGAWLPGRGAAAMLSIGAVVVTYFLNAIGATVDFLETPRKLSPFYWADASHVLIHGFDWVRFAGMTAGAAILVALALWGFERRDIASGGREWSLRALLTRYRHPGGPAEAIAPAGGAGG